jgi:translation initiation factor 2 gamma subunit (eIF-2gamma)|tara:strand:+ start:619 stop:843 length:225 start_codon:yes stop_codon:yes gene_type:complete
MNYKLIEELKMEGMALDTTQEVRIVVLQNKVDRLEEKQVELLDRLRTVEKWVAGAAAIIAAVSTVAGLAVALIK